MAPRGLGRGRGGRGAAARSRPPAITSAQLGSALRDLMRWTEPRTSAVVFAVGNAVFAAAVLGNGLAMASSLAYYILLGCALGALSWRVLLAVTRRTPVHAQLLAVRASVGAALPPALRSSGGVVDVATAGAAGQLSAAGLNSACRFFKRAASASNPGLTLGAIFGALLLRALARAGLGMPAALWIAFLCAFGAPALLELLDPYLPLSADEALARAAEVEPIGRLIDVARAIGRAIGDGETEEGDGDEQGGEDGDGDDGDGDEDGADAD